MSPTIPPRVNPKSPQHRASIVADLWQDLHDMAEDVIAQRMPHSAADFADRFLEQLRQRWGGGDRYIPAGDMNRRDKAIRAQFNGRNLLEVCATHGVSPATVYRLCDRRLRQPLRAA